MDDEFWHRKWRRNEIGFHEARVNPLLVRNLPALDPAPGARIFLPLCGKTLDIGWLLSKGYDVVGIDLSPIAVEQLFAELGQHPRISAAGNLQCHQGEGIAIFVGDVFDLDRALLGRVDAIYDRAALIALPASVRGAYAAHIVEISRAVAQLVITLDYDQSRMDGPPFSVTGEELARLYGRTHPPDLPADLPADLLESAAVPGGFKGLAATESAWLVRPGL